MDIEEQVFDPNADIFYNNKYLEVLERKDIVMDLEKPPKDVKFDIQFDESAVGEYKPRKLETEYDKKNYLENQIKNTLIRYYRIDLFKYKYLFKGNDNGMALSFNYITRKYGKTRIKNKTIFILDVSINYAAIKLHEYENCLFSDFSYDIFMNAIGCTIYALIFHKNNKSYVPSLKNESNGNIYHLINYDNNGNIIVKDNYFIIYDRLKNIRAELIFGSFHLMYYEFINKNELSNNLFVLYMYIMLKCSDIGSQLIMYVFKPTSCMKNIIQSLTSIYTKSRLVCPKTVAPYITFIHLQKLAKNILFDEIEKHIKNSTIFLKPLVSLFGTNYEQLTTFKNNITTHELRTIKYQARLLYYLFDKNFANLSRIIKKNIEIQQKNAARKYKYIKY
jgi:hypothetical protein